VFDSTNTRLGVGVATPGNTLDVRSVTGSIHLESTTGTNGSFLEIKNTGGTYYFGVENSAGTGFGCAPYALINWVAAGRSSQTYIEGYGVATTLSSTGNLGLGVTPSAWAASWKALEFGFGSVAGYSTTQTYVTSNAYNDGNWRYKNASQATQYQHYQGAHYWNNATASQSAGGLVNGTGTWTTQMTLDASGNLVIGDTSTGYRLDAVVSGTGDLNIASFRTTGASGQGIRFGVNTTNSVTTIKNNTGSGYGMAFYSGSGSSESMRIDSSGNLLVGTTSAKSKFVVEGGQISVGSTGSSGNGIYLYINNALSDNSYLSRASAGTGTTTWYIGNQAITTSSDQRLKADIKPSERNAIDLLNQWEIVDHTWNDPSDQCENNRNSRGVWTGVVAQQVQQVTPWLVNKPTEDLNEDGSINPWTMDFGYAVPLLVKAIQEQQAIITTLTDRITALEAK
jgi:hypothetical protein